MSTLTLVLTTAGREALINAQNTGVSNVVITQMGLSAQEVALSAATTVLPGEFKRLDAVGGQVVAPETFYVSGTDTSDDTWSVRTIGLYLSNGVLLGAYSQAAVLLEKAQPAMAVIEASVRLTEPLAAEIEFVGGGWNNPPATETVEGVIRLATQAQVMAGVNAVRAVTPKWLKALLDSLLPGYAVVGHTHDAAAIVSGVLAVGRIPALAMDKITGLIEALAEKANAIHTHAAADITAGVFAVARIPDLAMAKITGLATALAGKLDRSNGNTHIDTSMSGTLGIMSSLVPVGGGWSRSLSFASDPSNATRLFFGAYGAIADGGTPTYGFIAHSAAPAPYSEANGLRIYPTYAAWGASPLWHAGNFDPASKANAAHQHAGEDITSGTINDARLPATMSGKTFNAPIRLASSVPTLEMAEIDQANGAGRFMWLVNNGNLFLRRNTAPAGDFGTYATELTVDPNGVFGFRAAPKVGAGEVWHAGNFDPASKANAAHQHSGADITSGTVNDARLPATMSGKTFAGPVTIEDAAAVLALKENDQAGAPGAYRWAVSGGVLSLRRNTSAARDFITETTDLTFGQNGVIGFGARPTFAGATPWDSANFDPASKANTGHTHAAGDVTSGVFDVLRIPALAMDKITGLVEALAGKAAALHTHAAADITSGVLAVARIPDLAIAKITGLAAALVASTAAQFRGNTGTQPLHPSSVWSAAEIVNIAQAATLTIDMAAGLNFSTTMTGNRTLGAPTNAKPGQSGILTIIQDGTGFRTLTFDNAWKFAGGVKPALSGAAGSRDVLCFTVVAPGDVVASLMKDVK